MASERHLALFSQAERIRLAMRADALLGQLRVALYFLSAYLRGAAPGVGDPPDLRELQQALEVRQWIGAGYTR